MSWFSVQHSPEPVAMHTQELNDQRTNYIEVVTEEGLIGNLEASKHKLGRNRLTDERREELFQTYVAKGTNIGDTTYATWTPTVSEN